MAEVNEWRFKRDTAFRKQFFVPDSFAHPAKMDAQLLIRIVENYTKPGETILDPMAGSGTTMLACTLGRDVVLVELEEKFCKMMRDNWNEVRMRPQLGSTIGNCQIIQGDARQLGGLLLSIIPNIDYIDAMRYASQVDKIVTSPPYTNRMDGGCKGSDAGMHPYTDESRDTWRTQRDQQNIGNLPYGEIDKCIFSPPYAESVSADAGGERDQSSARQRERRLRNKGYDPAKYQGGVGRNLEVDFQYSKEPDNIGNLPYGQIDKIVTSPPYEGSISGESHTEEARAKEFDKLRKLGYKINPNSADNKVRAAVYSGSDNNIGNLKGDTYLEAMYQVYSQCRKVLKPGGLIILVTKNFIRNKKVIRLDLDTIYLCEKAGFEFVERHYRKLSSQSFWRIIYHQKHPEVEQIKYEDILVFHKGL